MQAHLGADPAKGLGKEMRMPHLGFQGAERVFSGLSAHPHDLRRLVQPLSTLEKRHIKRWPAGQLYSSWPAW